jgi:hypothetical protein
MSIIEGIRGEFESHMNEDLSVGRAVDGIYKRLRRLADRCLPLSWEAAQQLAADLSAIDSVLHVLLESNRR